MRRQRGLVGLTGLAALVGLGLIARPTLAAVTTEQSASILVFPKVIADGSRDTVIQITNTSNNMAHAHCFYVDGAPTTPGLPIGPLNPPLCTETDFDIWLTKQQPTHWVVSAGRLQNPLDAECSAQVMCLDGQSGSSTNSNCCDAGFDPGHVPPVAPDFTGELKCIQVDASGAPLSGNSLKGEATIEDPSTGDVSKYNAIGLRGNDNNNGDNVLCLGGTVTPDCPKGAEYDACPATWLLDHPATGAADPLIEEQSFCVDHPCSSMSTNLTLAPCTENFETQQPVPITLQFLVINEFEQTLSASTTFACWASFDLGAPIGGISDVFNTGTLGGSIAQTRMRSAAGTPLGVLAVIEETHHDFVRDLTTRSAQNGHQTFQDQPGPDLITSPGDQVLPPQ